MFTKRQLKKIATAGLAALLMLFQVGMASASTYTFTQTNWSSGATATTAVHDGTNDRAQQGWQQYATSTSAIGAVNGGVDLGLIAVASSTTQTSDATAVTGFNLDGKSFSGTTLSGAGDAASVKLNFENATYPWEGKANAPGATGIGGSMAYVGYDDSIYSLRGGITNAFYRYSVANNTWSTLTSAPGNIVSGSSLVYVATGGSQYLYAINSANLYRYSITEGSWTTLNAVGGGCETGSGGDLVYPGSGDYIYSSKGGNSTTFCRYSISGDSWEFRSSIPSAVGEGGALLYMAADNSIYALVGNSTGVFYRYSITSNSWSARADLPTTITTAGALSYPGSGDYVYARVKLVSSSYQANLFRYSISNNYWQAVSSNGSVGSGTDLVADGSGSFLYSSYSNYLYRYTIARDKNWATLSTTGTSFGMYSSMVAAGDYLYALRGSNSSDFYRYSINSDSWTAMAGIAVGNSSSLTYPGSGDHIYALNGGSLMRYSISGNSWQGLATAPAAIYGFNKLVWPGAGDYLYALRGGAGAYAYTDFYRYSISSNSWQSMASLPLAAEGGAGAFYPGTGDFIYALRGDGSANFYRYSIQNNTWSALTAVPQTVNGGSSFAYPGSGDYFYVSNGGSGGLNSFYRYSISGNSWTYMPSVPTRGYAIGYGCSMGYPGSGDYLYGLMYNTGWGGAYLLRFSTKSFLTPGTYTSGPIDPGVGVSAWGTIDWSNSTGQTITMKARSDEDGNFADAPAWTSCANISDNTAMSTGGCVTNGHRYVQYQATLSTTLDTISPSLDSVTISYSTYATDQSLTSSKYDTGSDANVMGSIAWDEDAALPSGTTLTVSLRTASSSTALDEATWYGFTASSTNCTKTDATVACPSAALASASVTLTDGANDRWYQYRVSATSNGSYTPTIPEVRVQYVVNAPPELTLVSALQIATSSDADWGKISIAYSVRDIDTNTGSVTPGYITPTFEYNIGGGWVAIDEAYLSAGSLDNKIVTQIGYAAYTATWDAKTQIPGQYIANAQIRVTANDNEAANNVASATASLALDTTAPVVSGTINGTTDEISFTVSDDGLVSYNISNNADGSYDGVNASSSSTINAGSATVVSTTTWNLAGEPSNQVVYLSAIDTYGNTASTTIVGPATPTYFDLKDASNVLVGNYQIFLSWKEYTATSSAAFNRYELYRSTDGYAYGLRSTITNSATNYYTDTGLASSTTYYYKLLAVDGDGDVSPYSTVLSHQPSGQGGTDATDPAISLVTATDTQSTYAKITFSTNELAFGTVEYGAEGGAPYALSVAKDTIATDHSIVLTDLTPNTNYTFRAKARDIAGNESIDDNGGAGYTFTTVGGPIITDVTATLADDRNATIVWNTNEDTNATVVYAETAIALANGTGVTEVIDTAFAGGEGPLYQHRVTLTGLTPRTTYYYYVKSTDGDGNIGVDKNGLNFYTVTTSYDRKAPNVSDIATPVITETAVVVLWKTDELADSQVSYGATSGSYTETTTLDTNMSIVHAVTLTGLTGATKYYYVVKSNDPGGNATTSAEQTVTTASAQEVQVIAIGGGSGRNNNPAPEEKDTTPATISNIKVASTTAFGAVISFETNEPTIGFVRYGENAQYGTVAGHDELMTRHEFTIAGLRIGTEYHFQVRAIDRELNISNSENVTFKTNYIAQASPDLRTVEDVKQYEAEVEATIESILPGVLPPFVEEPRVVEVTEDAAEIRWKTNIKSYAVILYAKESEFDPIKANPYTAEISHTSMKETAHKLTLVGLEPNTTYHFMVRSFSLPQVVGSSQDMTFTTKASKVAARVINVKNTSFNVVWTTEDAASTIVEYKNVKTGEIQRKIDNEKVKEHDVLVDRLLPATTYEVTVFGYNEKGNLIEGGDPIVITTIKDVVAPKISNFKVDGALVPGRTDRVQTVVTWTTDEPSDSTIYYQEGAGAITELANKASIGDTFTQNHTIILSNLKPGTIYQMRVESVDPAGNTASFGPRTIITPQKGESIFDVIFKNFEDTFKFLRGAGQ